jgi:hypothetical protein
VNAAERILLSLDAHECWGPTRVRTSVVRHVAVEPLVIDRGVDTFGTVLGQNSLAELQDLLNLWAYRMAQLTKAYGDFSPAWVTRDATGFVDWTNDWTKLQNRYNAAVSAANSAMLTGTLNPLTPNSMIPAGPAYNGLIKAMRQCAPPDGCPVTKGDWADLFTRLTVAAKTFGGAPPVDKPPQPQATDVDVQAFAATAPVDVVAQVTGAQAATTGPLPADLAKSLQSGGKDTWSLLLWLAEHQRLLIIGGVAIAGGILFFSILPVLMLPAKLAKTATVAAKVAAGGM